MQIHISRDGQSYGPYTVEQVQNYLKTGQIKPTDLAWREGVVDWRPLNTFPGFENLSSSTPPPIPDSHKAQPDYHHVSIAKFIILSLCTFGIYDLYWFYKNWKFIRDRDNSDISPFWRMFFSPFWCYSLSKDVSEARGQANLALSALIAILYFALSMLWRLPDPYWLIGLLTFVPLLYPVWQINQINNAKSVQASYHSRFKIWHIILCLFGALLLLLSAASTLNLIPSTLVVDGDRMPAHYLSYLKKAEIVDESESILYFYSTGLFSIEDDGNLITTRRVISYAREASGEMTVESAAYKDIQDIEVTPGESSLDDTIVYIELNEDDGFYLVVSAEEDRDKLFIDKLKALWKEHRPQATTSE